MNPNLSALQPYPFEKLATLTAAVEPNQTLDPIALSVGEPKHEAPGFVLTAITNAQDKFQQYPATKGLPELREAIAKWLIQRFQLKTDSLCADNNILPVNGTREALFAFAQVIIDPSNSPLVMMPNPFYQIYEGAALLANAEPYYLNCDEENHFLPDLSAMTEQQWQRCQLFYICSPNNPTGAVASLEYYQTLIELADKYDFVIASDECYSEIYPNEDQPPVGLLEACASVQRDHYERCIVFHSLSKRSNLPGLRSGFVAGDSAIIKRFLQYRTYHGCAMSLPAQLGSIAAWKDEAHVIRNRERYREKFARVQHILKDVWSLTLPEAGFNFWAKTPCDDLKFTQSLLEHQNIKILPGSYLSRDVNGKNPGQHYVRMAMVASLGECETAAYRIKEFLAQLT